MTSMASPVSSVAVDDHAAQGPGANARMREVPVSPKKPRLLFYEMAAHPEDLSLWSGIPAHIVDGLRSAGVTTTCVAGVPRWLARVPSSALWHYYRTVRKQSFIADRHPVLNRLFSAVGNARIESHREADAIVTTSIAGAAHLKTSRPVFIIHDATWEQIMELYPWYARSAQPDYMVKSGWDLERKACSRPNHYFVMASDWARDRLIADHRLPVQRVFTLPLGANFSEDPVDEEVNRAIAARSGEHCHLLWVGVEFERKGGAIAVAAAQALRARGIPTTLHIAGCAPSGLPSWVEVHGFLRKSRPEERRKLEALYAQSDFFILPTQAEAQGIVFNEAAGYGLPAAATDVGGVSSVVRNGDWGILLRPEAPAPEYAAWIAGLFRDRARYREAAEQARRDFVARLSRSAYTRRLLGLIRQVLDRDAIPGKEAGEEHPSYI
jgi:glycosyltransferase involved in cell wall biosynthesis